MHDQEACGADPEHGVIVPETACPLSAEALAALQDINPPAESSSLGAGYLYACSSIGIIPYVSAG